jgi:hypothetical protein
MSIAKVIPASPALGQFGRRGFLAGLGVGGLSAFVGSRQAQAGEPDLMSPHLTGSVPFAVVLCGFTDMPDLGIPTSVFQDYIATPGRAGMVDYWRDVSYGALDLSGSKVFGWYRMQYSFFNQGVAGRGAWIVEARRLAAAAGVDLSPFYGVIAVVNANVDDSSDGGKNLALGIKADWGQKNWRWCRNCQVLAYGGGARGACAAGGVHDLSASADYTLALNDSTFPGQEGWRWCRKCTGLAYAGFTAGFCPAGGRHDHRGSGAYRVAMSPAGFPGQTDWKWCRNCQAIAYSKSDSGPGSCPAGGKHDHSASADYTLSMPIFGYETHFDVSFGAHEIGHAFGLVHGHCAGVDPSAPGGDYCNPWDIMGSGGNFIDPGSRFSPVGPGISGVDAHRFGWIPPARVFTAEKSGSATVKLAAISEPSVDGHLLARIVRPGHVFTVEYRQRTGWDRGLSDDAVVIHDLRTPYTVGHQDNWKWCKKCEGLAYGGFAPGPCPAGGRHDHIDSGIYGLMYAPSSFTSDPRQNNWRWCRNCQGLAYNGFGPGRCPAGGVHDHSASLDYSLILGPTTLPGQPRWRWCRNCQGLAFAGHPTAGPCPAGGRHDHSASGEYTLLNFAADEPFYLRSCKTGDRWVNFETGTTVVVERIDTAARTASVTLG